MKTPTIKDPKVMTLTEIHREMEEIYYQWVKDPFESMDKEMYLLNRYKELQKERLERYN